MEAERTQEEGSGNPREGQGAGSDRGKERQACSPAPLEKVSWLMIRNSGACPLPAGMNPQQTIAPLGSGQALSSLSLQFPILLVKVPPFNVPGPVSLLFPSPQKVPLFMASSLARCSWSLCSWQQWLVQESNGGLPDSTRPPTG